MNADDVRERAVGVLEHREGEEERHEDDHGERRHRSTGAPPGAARARPRRRTRRRRTRSRRRTRPAPEPAALRTAPSTSSAPVAAAAPKPTAAISSRLREAEQPEADHLAGQQVRRADRREHDLDDPRGLLLDDAGRDPVPVGQQLAVEDEDDEERVRRPSRPRPRRPARSVAIAQRLGQLGALGPQVGRLQQRHELVVRRSVGREISPPTTAASIEPSSSAARAIALDRLGRRSRRRSPPPPSAAASTTARSPSPA